MELAGRKPGGRPKRSFMDVGKADLKFIGVREEHAEDKGRQVIGCGHT